jgi:hypothetical protein
VNQSMKGVSRSAVEQGSYFRERLLLLFFQCRALLRTLAISLTPFVERYGRCASLQSETVCSLFAAAKDLKQNP